MHRNPSRPTVAPSHHLEMGAAHAGLDPPPRHRRRPRRRRRRRCFVWWLLAAADGAEAYADFAGWATWKWALIVWIGLTWASSSTLLSGLRHFVMDIGAGYELPTNKFWANMTVVGAVAADRRALGLDHLREGRMSAAEPGDPRRPHHGDPARPGPRPRPVRRRRRALVAGAARPRSPPCCCWSGSACRCCGCPTLDYRTVTDWLRPAARRGADAAARRRDLLAPEARPAGRRRGLCPRRGQQAVLDRPRSTSSASSPAALALFAVLKIALAGAPA